MVLFDKKQLSEASTWTHQSQVKVRFQDVDAAGIVFFARFFDYAHETYEGFLSSIGLPLAQVLREQSWAAPLKHVEADYFRPVRFGDELMVQLVRSQVDGSDVLLGWRFRVGEQSVAVAQTVHCFVSAKDFKKREVPREILSALGH